MEQVAIIGLAISGDPKAIGELRIAAGEDAKEVSRWVMVSEMERRQAKVYKEAGVKDGS